MVSNESKQVIETETSGLLVAPESTLRIIQQTLLAVLEQTYDYLHTQNHTGLNVQVLLLQGSGLANGMHCYKSQTN